MHHVESTLLLPAAIVDRFGRRESWPESTPVVVPYLRIIFTALEVPEAEAFFESARRAYRKEKAVAAARTYPLGFPTYLSVALDDTWEQDRSLRRSSAWEAMKAVHALVGEDPHADFEQYLDCGVQVCQDLTAEARSHGGTPFAGLLPVPAHTSAGALD